MIKTIFATKVGMTSVFTPEGEWLGVTTLKALPMTTESVRTTEKHGYQALRLKIADTRVKRSKHFFREVRTEEVFEPGVEIKPEEVLQVGDMLQISGVSKGKGTAGVVKRHNFKGGPRTHGQSDRERAPGSSGSNTTPGRVLRGKRRAGHMGVDKVTLRGMKLIKIDPTSSTLIVQGAVPGARGGVVTIKKL